MADLGRVREVADALCERYEATGDPADRDAVIRWGECLLTVPGLDEEDLAFLHGLVGRALIHRAGTAADASPEADRDRVATIGHLEAQLALMAPANQDRGDVLATLAVTYGLRYLFSDDADASTAQAKEWMASYATQAWPLLSPNSPVRPFVGFFLGIGLVAKLDRPGEPVLESASFAFDVLTEIEPELPDQDLRYASVMMLATLAAIKAGFGWSPTAANSFLRRAIDELPAGSPAWSAGLSPAHCALVSMRALLSGSADRLDLAVDILTAAAGDDGLSAAQRAGTQVLLGQALLQRSRYLHSDEDADQGIACLKEVWQTVPHDDFRRVAIASGLSSALASRFGLRGDRRDLDAAEWYGAAAAELAAVRGGIGGGQPGRDLNGLAFSSMIDGYRGYPDFDRQVTDAAIRGIRAALDTPPESHQEHSALLSELGQLIVQRAAARSGTESAAEVVEALGYLRTSVAMLGNDASFRPVAVLRLAAGLLHVGQVAADPSLLTAAISHLDELLADLDPRSGHQAMIRLTGGLAAHARYQTTSDPDDLRLAADWLEQACAELDQRPGHPSRARALSELARCYWVLGDTERARETGQELLREYGISVLLQTGTARSLPHAQMAADEATALASRYLAAGDIAAAINALELGRSLILHAATAVTDIAAMLDEAGAADLAARWRSFVTGPGRAEYQPWDDPVSKDGFRAQQLEPALLRVPDDLRARAIRVLAGPSASRLVAAPEPSAISGALTSTGADALVYLVEATGAGAGQAIIVPESHRPDEPEVLELPLLHTDQSAALDAYLDAYAALTGNGASAIGPPPDAMIAPARDRWRSELDNLCGWAWAAVMEPLLASVAQWGLERPPRLVLVPVGRLSVVPWHAAHPPAGGDGPCQYACSAAVFSYAASGRQLIEVSNRPVLGLRIAPVIVGDPARRLPFAGLEAQAIFEGCYPAARYFGQAGNWPGRSADGPGNSAEVLAALPGGIGQVASVLHLGCHARIAGANPGDAYLELADHARLTIEEILTQAAGRPPDAHGGLVSLASCVSDYSGAVYDEALTLATSFLAGGAVTVTGARWNVDDDATSLLMFMFHYFMAVRDESSRDALRAAQLWMLDPARVAPPEMPYELAKDAAGLGSVHIADWAAFTHQGR